MIEDEIPSLAPENMGFQMEGSLPTINLQGRASSFRECKHENSIVNMKGHEMQWNTVSRRNVKHLI